MGNTLMAYMYDQREREKDKKREINTESTFIRKNVNFRETSEYYK